MTEIIPCLTGGLGNRLFQYAAAKGLAEKWGGRCMYSTDAIAPNDHGSPDAICRLFPEPFAEQPAAWTDLNNETFADCYTYLPFPETPPSPSVRIHGYRQSARYFPTAPLRPHWEAFLTESDQAALLAKYSLPTDRPAWSLHIRLGDYKILPHHQIDVLRYSEQCLRRAPRNARIFLFSDEPAFCEAPIRRLCGLRTLELTVCHEEEIPSLWLMSRMDGAIVCNSTFSWWGAYFAHIANPEVVAFFPESWGRGMPPATDIVPPWGRKVKN